MTQTQAPIAGVWVVESSMDLTPEIVDRVKDKLLTAVEDHEQIIVSDGIEFRWRPTRIDPSNIDVELLARALSSAYWSKFPHGSLEDWKSDAQYIIDRMAEYAGGAA